MDLCIKTGQLVQDPQNFDISKFKKRGVKVEKKNPFKIGHFE